MKNFLKLLQNELIKLYRQIGWKVLTILALVISIAFPLLSLGVNNLGSGSRNYREIAESQTDSLWKAYYETYADADDFFKEKNINRTNWQFDYYYYDYINACLNIRAMDFVIADKEMTNLPEIFDVFYIDGMERVWEGEEITDKYTYSERTQNPVTGEYTYGEKADLTPELARRLKQRFTSDKTRLEKLVNTKFSVFVADKFKSYTKEYQEFRNELKAAEALYQTDKSVTNRYQQAKLKSDGMEYILQAQKEMTFLDSLSLKEQTNIVDILNFMENTVVNRSDQYAAQSEEEFDLNIGLYYKNCYFENYDDYTAAVQRQQETYYQGLKQYGYALTHNIPIARLDSSSTRKNLEDALSVNCIVAMFLSVLLSAAIVASEHTSGAIRLLMIRPRARWKILLSKLLCVITYTIALIIATSIISTIVEAIIYGAEDLSIPYLTANSASVTELPPIVYYIGRNLLLALPWIFASCAAFFLSVFTKRAIPATAISMLIAVFGNAATPLAYDAVAKAKWLKLTPIPYFSIVSLFPDPMFISGDWQSPRNYGLTLPAGIAVFSAYTLIMLILSFVIFNKEQIKN